MGQAQGKPQQAPVQAPEVSNAKEATNENWVLFDNAEDADCVCDYSHPPGQCPSVFRRLVLRSGVTEIVADEMLLHFMNICDVYEEALQKADVSFQCFLPHRYLARKIMREYMEREHEGHVPFALEGPASAWKEHDRVFRYIMDSYMPNRVCTSNVFCVLMESD